MPKGAFSHKGHTLMGETKHLVSPLARLILAKMRARASASGSHSSSGSRKVAHRAVGSRRVGSRAVGSRRVGSRRVGSRRVGSRRLVRSAPALHRRRVGSRRVGSRRVGSRRVGSRRVGSRRVGSRRVVGSRPMPGFAGPGSRRPELGPRVLTGSQRMLLARLHKARSVSQARSAQFGGACRKMSGCVKSRAVGIRRKRDSKGHLRLRNYAHEGKGISNAVGRLALGFAASHPRVARRSLKGPGRAFRGGKRTMLGKTVDTVASTTSSAVNKVVRTGKGLLGMKGGAHRRRRVHRGGNCGVGAPIDYSMSA